MSKTYLFTVGPSTPPAMTIDPGAEIEVTVDGAFDDIEDITPRCRLRSRRRRRGIRSRR